MSTPPIRMYATAWCLDCWLAKRVLDEHGTPYEYVDINTDSDAARLVEETNGGNRSVPTIFFPDGSILVEPSRKELGRKLEEVQPRTASASPDSGVS